MAVDKSTEIKELLEIIKHKIDMLESSRMGQSATISLMKDQLSMMNKKFDEMMDRLDDPETGLKRIYEQLMANTGSLVTIEGKINVYDDMYQMNNDNVKKLDKRLDLLEEDAGVEVPPELQLADVS